MMMRHKPEDFYGHVSAKGIMKLDRIADQERIRISHLSMASRRIVAEYPHLSAWYCLIVDDRREFTVEKMLYEENVEALVPTWMSGPRFNRGRMSQPQKLPVMPGYVAVQCVPHVACFVALRRVKHVKGIIGGLEKPYKIPSKHIDSFRQRAVSGSFDHRQVKIEYHLNEPVKVIDGPFASFDAIVVAVDEEDNRVKVEVNIFGRNTPVELDVDQIEKV